MADEFEDDLDGRLVIATDDERVESAEIAGSVDKTNSKACITTDTATASIRHESTAQSFSVKDKDNVAVDLYKQGQLDVELAVSTSHSPKLCEQSRSELPTTLIKSELINKQKDEEFSNMEQPPERAAKVENLSETVVKWEELDGGVVSSVPVVVKRVKTEQKSVRQFETVAKRQNADGIAAVNEPQHGVHNFLNSGIDTKRKKVMLDKGTCVFSKSNGNGIQLMEENLLAMRPGTNLTIDITIICKAGSNTLYFSAKWKGREYHGVLTDGEPMFSHSYAQKRNAAYNTDKCVLEGGGGNCSSDANIGVSPGHSTEKGSGLTGKRGGKRGVAQTKNGAEKRAKNQESNSDSIDEKISRKNNNNNESKTGTDNASLGIEPINHVPDNKTSSHLHHHHAQQKHSLCSASSNRALYDGDAAARIRCPHQQCGFRFETNNELSTHFLIGVHGTEGSKVKIFESSATQTTPVEYVSTGSDPCFPSDNDDGVACAALISGAGKDVSVCQKCRKEMTTSPTKTVRPALLECGVGDKARQKGDMTADNSPGFSDISDDAAPTLEKEESFDKQSDESKKASTTTTTTARFNSITLDSTSPQLAAVSTPSLQPHHPAVIPPKCASPTIQPIQSSQIGIGTLEAGSTTCLLPKIEDKLSSSNIIVATTSTSASTATTFTESSTNSAACPYQTSSTTNAAASFFNPYLQFGPHLTQAFANALAQQGANMGIVPSSSSTVPVEVTPMPSASAAGLLSLGTPLASLQSHSTNGGVPSKSAESPSTSHQPIQHKIYELQHQIDNTNALIGRASSTKPGSGGGNGVGSGVSPASADMAAMMRPNSTISAIGHQQQRSQLLHSGQQQHQQQQQQLSRPPHPSPIGIGSQHPPAHPHNFFPLPSMIVGAGQFCVQQGGGGATPSSIVASTSQQQQQQQLAAMRRGIGQSSINAAASSSNNAFHQQQTQQPPPLPTTTPMMPSFVPPGLPPNMLAAAAAASGFDMNTLQQYAALMASSGVGNISTGGVQQQQPNKPK